MEECLATNLFPERSVLHPRDRIGGKQLRVVTRTDPVFEEVDHATQFGADLGE